MNAMIQQEMFFFYDPSKKIVAYFKLPLVLPGKEFRLGQGAIDRKSQSSQVFIKYPN